MSSRAFKSDFIIQNLGCANCAAKIEKGIAAMDPVTEASLNFATKKIHIQTVRPIDDKMFDQMNHIVLSAESGAKLIKEEEHSSGEDEEEEAAWKKWARLLAPIALFALSFAVEGTPRLMLLGIAYLLAGGDVLLSAFRNILRGKVFDENFLMSIASIGAIAIGEYSEGVAVMIFYSVGEFMQDLAVDQSRKSIAGLMDIRPDSANLVEESGVRVVNTKTVNVGDFILVRPGEKIPLDGVVAEGSSFLDTSALTGESVPRAVKVEDEVLSGSVNNSGLLKIRVTKPFGESTVTKILQLVEESGAKKAPTEKMITKFARVYTPVVVALAAILAFVVPMILGEPFETWIYRSLVFLVASCPCALVVSIPLSYFAGIGKSSKEGILVKGGNYLEALSKVDALLLDKTGTITQGNFEVTDVVVAEGFTEKELIEWVRIAELHSTHPIAKSIVNKFGEGSKQDVRYEEISGEGIVATTTEGEILAGNDKLLRRKNIRFEPLKTMATVVYVAYQGKYVGAVLIQDQLKPGVEKSIQALYSRGIERIVMLTGDHRSIADEVAKSVGIREVHAELLPQDKVKEVEKAKQKHDTVAFVGDGINDAPVLISSDIGIAMGGVGSDAAIEASDVVLMKDDLSKLPVALQIAKETRKIVIQNIVFALGFKVFILILGALGMVNMWMAVFADVGVAIIAILNAMRILRLKDL